MIKIHLLQEFIALGLRATMLPFIFREVLQRNKVTILAYHKILTALFEKHVQYIIKRYSVIPLEQLIKAKYENLTENLPTKSVIITFDDGAKINYSLRNVLQKYHIPVTMFVCSDILGTNRHFWFSHCGSEKTKLKLIPDAERLKLLSQVGYDEKKNYETPDVLSETEARDLLSCGVSLQSHTLTHPILPMCDDSKAEEEIKRSRFDLENKFGIRVDCFAYPNGDYLPRDINLCLKAGYSAAVTMDSGFNDNGTDVYRLKRISICDNASVNQCAVRASGVWDFAKHIFKSDLCKAVLPRFLPLRSGQSSR